MKTKNEIIEIANGDWAEYYKIEQKDFSRNGTFTFESERLKGKNSIAMRFVGKKTLLSYDRLLKEEITKIIERNSHKKIDQNEILNYFGKENVTVDSETLALFVAEDELINPQALDTIFRFRKLTKNDEKFLNELNRNCTQEEVENAFVEIDHDIILGVFNNEKLVAAASVLDWGAFFDIGVITHTGYRKLGLGKFVVHQICKEIFKTDKIPLYRCEADLVSSIGVARSLGFKIYNETYHKEIYIKVQKD